MNKKGLTLVEFAVGLVIIAALYLVISNVSLKVVDKVNRSSFESNIVTVCKTAHNQSTSDSIMGDGRKTSRIYCKADGVSCNGELSLSGSKSLNYIAYVDEDSVVKYLAVKNEHFYFEYVGDISNCGSLGNGIALNYEEGTGKEITNDFYNDSRIFPEMNIDDSKINNRIESKSYLKESTSDSFLGISSDALDKSKIEKIAFSKSKRCDGALSTWDGSEAGDGSVMVWTKDEDNNGLYELYIGQDEGVIANPNSSYLFSGFYNVKSIDLTYLATDRIENMDYMFNTQKGNCLDCFDGESNSALTDIIGIDKLTISSVMSMNYTFAHLNNISNLDLSSWNVSNVTSMNGLFEGTGYNAESLNINLSKWDTSNVLSMTDMFKNIGVNAKTFNIKIAKNNSNRANVIYGKNNSVFYKLENNKFILE